MARETLRRPIPTLILVRPLLHAQILPPTQKQLCCAKECEDCQGTTKSKRPESLLPRYLIARPPSNQDWIATLRSVMRRFRFLALAITLTVQTVAALGQLSTGDHLAEPGFWPTQSQPSRDGLCRTGNLRALSCRQDRDTNRDPDGSKPHAGCGCGYPPSRIPP